MGYREEEMLRAALEQAKETIEALTGPPHQLARVIRARVGTGDAVQTVLAYFQGQPVVLSPRPGVSMKGKDVPPGAWLAVQGTIMLSVQKDLPLDAGRIVTVSDVVNDEVFEAHDDSAAMTRFTKHKDLKIEKGDRVLVIGEYALRNLGQQTKTFAVEPTKVSWSDIGGQTEAKLALREAVEFPHTHKELYSAYGKRATKGVLLHGPSGTGKTMLAKATATALATTHGAQHSTGFIYVKGPEVLSKWVGESEATIRGLFSRAREHKRAHGYPAVIFVDEADALLGKRGGGGTDHRGVLSSTIVPMFLAEMDGFEESAAVVLLATNRPDVLDPAVVREGRVDRKVYVGRPTKESAPEIFAIHLKGIKLAKNVSIEEMAVEGTNMLYDQTKVLYRVKRQGHVQPVEFTLGHVASGAMIAGMCQQAVGTALHRDIEAKTKTPSGISKEDFSFAASQLWRANLNLNHEEDLATFVHPFKDEVTDVVRVSA